MKKSIVTVVVVFVAAVAALPIIYHYIQGQQNQVFVTETVIAGKPSAAKGITLNFKQCDVASGKLFWDINYKISKGTKTTAQFHKVTDGHYDAFFKQAYVDIEDGLPHSSLEIGPSSMAKDILYDVAKRTQNNNQPHKETLLLKDYYEYYPMNLEINMEGYYINNPTPAGQATGQYFKIPVPDTYTVDVSVTKNQSGKTTDYDITSPYTYLNVPVQNIFTTSGCYLVLGTPTYGTSFDEDTQELGEEWEIQLPKEMRGIHFIPFTAKEGNPRWLSIDLEHAKMAYPLSSGCRVVDLRLSEDGKNLLLLTQEKKDVYLRVIDRKSMKLQQKIFLFQNPQEIWTMTMAKEDGKLLTIFDDGQFYLFTQKGNQYHMELSDNLHQADQLSKIKLREPFLSFDYDGRRLALASYDADGGYYEDLTTSYLYLFDKEGLLYAGRYRSSLGRIKAASNGIVPAITFYKKNNTLPESTGAIQVRL